MGGTKTLLWTLVEPMLDAFVQKHGREPTVDEEVELWKEAESKHADQVDHRADILREKQ